MNELLAQVITPQVQSFFGVFAFVCVFIYVLVVIWVARDAYQRGTLWWAWALVSLVPIVGVIAYVLLRPSLMQIDRDEQELEVALKQRELMKYGECAKCGYPVQSDYIVCPNCRQRLKNVCANPACGRPLDPSWNVCPYCAHPAPGRTAQASPRRAHAAE